MVVFALNAKSQTKLEAIKSGEVLTVNYKIDHKTNVKLLEGW